MTLFLIKMDTVPSSAVLLMLMREVGRLLKELACMACYKEHAKRELGDMLSSTTAPIGYANVFGQWM